MNPVLLKAPLLLLTAYCAHVVAKSPNPPATFEEQARYRKDNRIRDPVTSASLWRAKMFRRIIYSVSVFEAVLALICSFEPESSTLNTVHETLVPSVFRVQLSKTFIIGIILAAAGAVIRASCYRHLGRFFTFELSVKSEHRLVTDGPYSVVRHPAYVGSILFYAGVCCTHIGPGSLLASLGLWSSHAGRIYALLFIGYGTYVSSFLVARVAKEDLVLKKQFGVEWSAWAKHTPYRLIPYVY